MNAAADGSCSPPLELVDELCSSLRACVPNYVALIVRFNADPGEGLATNPFQIVRSHRFSGRIRYAEKRVSFGVL